MRIVEIVPPREFTVGSAEKSLRLRDCAHIELDADEQVTFVTASGTAYDFCRKDWGYYATPSLNSRLGRFGLRAALVRGSDGKAYVMAVESSRQPEFDDYLKSCGHCHVCWLDEEEVLSRIETLFRGKS